MPVKPVVCFDKQCQETSKVHMRPVQPAKKSHVICTQCQDQQNYNLSTRKCIRWSFIKYPWVMARKANIPSLTRVQCVLTRTVKIPSLCGQWSQK